MAKPVSQATVWALRLLAFAESRRPHSARALEAAWARALGFGERQPGGLADLGVQKALRKRLRKAGVALAGGAVAPSSIQYRNAALLATKLGLEPVAQTVLLFAATAHTDSLIQEAFWHLGPSPVSVAYELLAEVLGLDQAAVKLALAPGSILHATGLVRLVECQSYDHREPLQLTWGLSALLSRVHPDADSLLAGFFRRAKATSLTTKDFLHVEHDVAILSRLVAPVAEPRQRAANVLLYGAPGTGKTELARAIAASLAADLFEVNVDDEDGAPISREGRLSACALTQRMLAQRSNAILLFDEIEDIFPHRGSKEGTGESGRDKGFTIRLLEDARVPTIWIGNRVSQIDPAFLRRFDYALELRSPPAMVRRRLVEQQLPHAAVSERWLAHVASDARLTPAQIERSARVTQLLSPAAGEETEKTFTRVLESGLALLQELPTTKPKTVGAFDLSYLRANEDLNAVVRGLCRTRRGRLCLFGPPGTGKSAFARHLATELDCPVISRSAADLMSKWLGETEQALREMFEEARGERALLLLDEADSFFRSRARSVSSWEVTQVNELLLQMEAFDGVFVCTTNLMDDIDEAALRRFTLKIRFDPMTAEQRWRMFQKTLETLDAGLVGDPAALRAGLDRLDRLTPGDFAVVAERLRLLGEPVSGDRLLCGLGGEVAAKPGARRSLGFTR